MGKHEKTLASKKTITSIDVAKLANVSQSTVSRVFSMNSSVNPDTYSKVIAAAEQLGYTPNAIARSLSSNRTNIIAIVTINSVSPHRSRIISKLSRRFHEEEKQILYFETGYEQKIGEILDQIIPYQVDGIVVTSASVMAESKEQIFNYGIPIVIFNKHTRTQGIHSVCSDNVESGRMVASFFVEKGYRSFAFLGSSVFRSTSNLRMQGFVGRLKEYGINECLCIDGNYTYESGRTAMRKLFEIKKGEFPMALFCADDLMALGALDSARNEVSLRVPEDIAICGFDDIEMASWQCFNLTTVHQPIDEMVEETCRYIMARLNNDDNVTDGLQLFRCSIVERGTT